MKAEQHRKHAVGQYQNQLGILGYAINERLFKEAGAT
jgi:hypothetical protein